MADSLRIYHLQRIQPADWEEMSEVVVVAVDEWMARQTAAETCGNEGTRIWLSKETSLCRELGIALVGVRPGKVCDVTLYG